MLPLALTTAAVVLISAFCSLCEAVLYSVPASEIARLKEKGDKAGLRLAALREHVDEPITAILTVNTVANTAGAAVAGALATKALGEGQVILFSAALTVAILLFSEIVPKTFGVVYTRALAPILSGPLTGMVFVLKPVVLLIGFVTRLISRGQKGGITPDEIVSMARAGSSSGVIDEGEARVIQNILGLSKRRAKDIMTPRTVVFALPAGISVGEAAAHKKLMVHSRVPVYDDGIDDIMGFVFRRDVLATSDNDLPLGHLVRPGEFVVELEPVDVVLDTMLEHKLHMLMVVDGFGGFAGVVTLEDVLEEILGEEIVDEFDQVADLRELAMQRRAAALKRIEGETG